MTQSSLFTKTHLFLLRFKFRIAMRPWIGWLPSTLLAIAFLAGLHLLVGRRVATLAFLLMLQLPLITITLLYHTRLGDRAASSRYIEATLGCLTPRLRADYLNRLNAQLQRDRVISEYDLVIHARAVDEDLHENQQILKNAQIRIKQQSQVDDLSAQLD